MSAGDYLVHRNSANTDAVPDAGSDLLLQYAVEVASKGSIATYSVGTFTLAETGKYLILASDQAGTTDVTNNERISAKTTFNLAGTELVEGYCAEYIRKSSGSQEYISFSAGVIEVTSLTGSNADLQVRTERIDNSTTGTVNRIADRSGITILKLDDTWGYGRYRSSAVFASSGTDNAATVANLQTTVEEDSPFTRTTNTIDIATTNPVLAIYSVKSEDAPGNRSEFQSRLTLAGTVVPGSYGQTYIRNSDNSIWGGMSVATLLYPTSGDNLELEIVSRELGGNDWEAALQLIELPVAAKSIIVEATTGDINGSGVDFAWDTLEQIDTDVFTHTAGQANLDVDIAGDYLALSSVAVASDAGSAGTRAVSAMQFRVEGVDDETTGNSGFNRASGTADHGSMAMATVLSGLSVNDSIVTRMDRIGTVSTTINNTVGAMALIQLDSLFVVAGGVSDVETVEFKFDNSSIVINGANFDATEGTLYLNDANTLDGGEVDISSAIDSWSDVEVVVDFTLLSEGALTNLHTLGPGTLYFILDTDASDVYASAALTVHRPTALALSLSDHFASEVAITAAKLTGGTGSFTNGLLSEDTNPLTTLNIGDDDHTEVAFVFEALTASVDAFVYEIEIVVDGTPDVELDTYPTTSARVTIGSSSIDSSISSGSFTISGSTVGTLQHRVTPAATAAFTLSGSTVDTLRNTRTVATTAAFTISGSTVGTLRNQKVSAVSGAFALSGSEVTSLYNRVSDIGAGTYSLTGAEVDTLQHLISTVTSGTYNLLGTAIDTVYFPRLSAVSGTYALSGSTVATVVHLRSAISSGAFDLAGLEVGTLYSQISPVTSGTYSVSGAAVGTLYNQLSGVVSGAYNIVGSNIGTLHHQLSGVASGSFALSGLEVASGANLRSTIVSGTYSVSGSTVGTLYHQISGMAAGSFALDGDTIGTAINLRSPIASGSFDLAGTTIGTLYHQISPVASGSYSVSGLEIGTLHHQISGMASGSFLLTGTALATRQIFSSPIASGLFSVTGNAIGTLYHRYTPVASGTYTLSGTAVGTVYGRRAEAESGSFSLAGSTISTLFDQSIEVSAGSFSISGTAVDTLVNRLTGIAVGSFTLSGSSVDTLLSLVGQIESGSYLIAGQNITTTYTRESEIGAGSYTLLGSAIGSTRHIATLAASGAFTLSGSTTDTLHHHRTSIASGSFVITASSIDSLRSLRAAIQAGAFSLDASNVQSLRNYISEIGSGSYVLTYSELTSGVQGAGGFISEHTLYLMTTAPQQDLYLMTTAPQQDLYLMTTAPQQDLHLKTQADLDLSTKSSLLLDWNN